MNIWDRLKARRDAKRAAKEASRVVAGSYQPRLSARGRLSDGRAVPLGELIESPLPGEDFNWWWSAEGYMTGHSYFAARMGWDACKKFYELSK